MLFFFSSRRRHTRSLCDWSSDVCSSDLLSTYEAFAHVIDSMFNQHAKWLAIARELSWRARSEERRVGKECRIRGRPERRKKKTATAREAPPTQRRLRMQRRRSHDTCRRR